MDVSEVETIANHSRPGGGCTLWADTDSSRNVRTIPDCRYDSNREHSFYALSLIAFFFVITTLFAASASAAPFAPSPTIAELATKTGKTINKAPDWAKHGAFVYRISTPDNADVLPDIAQGMAMTNHLLDDSVHQITIINGLIGDDHLGKNNWDGLWPYWDRATFRAGDWNSLHDFMQQVNKQDNTSVSFHVNLTDVSAGLRQYPETRAFFQKLVAAKAIYYRNMNPITHMRDLPAYVPQEIPADAKASTDVFAHVDYKNFWDSGLAKQMIDNFYNHLPYAPPILYLDVLTLSDNNGGTGLPDGTLGGSKASQLEGVLDIAAYLNSKGTSIATEGDRPFLIGRGATYGWLHCNPGYSTDDYSYIAGAARDIPVQQVAGDTGCFNLAPIASTAEGLAVVRNHYAKLLSGAPDPKPTPGLDTDHIAYPVSITPGEFDIPGTGDIFRGDWADNINNFYLTGIQELYHIGKRDVRTAVFNKYGVLHVSRFGLVDPSGKESFIDASDIAPPNSVDSVKKAGHMMLEQPVSCHFNAPAAGLYQMIFYGNIPGPGSGALNIYVNGQLQQTVLNIHFPSHDRWQQPFPLGEITLRAGDNVIAFDTGPIYMKWSDDTTALWSTPYLHTGFKVTNGDVTYADDYDRMWPDTWSGQKKIYFFCWDGSRRTWKLPSDWATVRKATLYPLTPGGRGLGVSFAIGNRSISPKLLPQIPYILVPQT